MDSFGIGSVAGLGATGIGLVWLTVRRVRQRLAARAAAKAPEGRVEGRIEALAIAQADMAARLEALAVRGAAPEQRLQAMAGQMLGLIRDKNATLETALAGLDQLRARMRTLEQIGEPAEARALIEGLGERLDALQVAQTAGTAALETRIGLLEAPGAATEIGERLAQLHAQRDAGLEAVLARLAPLETRLGALEGDRAAGAADREAAKRLEGRLEALAAEQGGAKAELARLKAEARGGEALAGQLARLHEQKEALAEAVLARLVPLEAKLVELQAALGGLDPRLALLEGAGPFAEISEQLTRLYAQKDATVETVFARLAPLEAKLAELDPASALDRFTERLEAVQGRVAALEGAENPFAEISEQLTRLYAQKDATVETVFARLAPLEAKLAELDPASALDRFTERLEAVQGRVAALEGAENPFAEISEQLTRLYAQKDATVETVFARLAPLEAKLAELDPASALDRFTERLEAVQGRVAALEGAENPFAEISEQLTRLYAQKDATVETVFARLAPLEAKLAELDPASALDRFTERLEAVQGRVAALEGAENPFAEISEQLTRLYAQKDATVETVFARLAPLEAKLAELEGGVQRLAPLAEEDPRAAVAELRERLEALQRSQGEMAVALKALEAAAADGGPLAEVADQLTRLYAHKDAGIAALLTRLAPLEARPWDPEAETARAEAIAGQLIAAHAAAEQTALFADRLSHLEASLPRPTAAQRQVLDGRGAPAPAPERAAEALDAIWTLPRIVSLHQK